MFFGMLFALPLYVILEFIRTYQAKSDPALKAQMDREPKVTFKMLMVLGVPAIFDLSSVLLMVAGLMHIDASMWMLLRGGGIVFVALMKQFALGDRLSANMWWGVLIIALAVALVGCSSMLNGHPKPEDGKSAVGPSASDLLVGISLTIAGTFMQSLQYVYEEKVMTGSTAAPPWLLIGMEGFFGTLICTVVVYPLAGIIPGNDHGCIEYLPNTIAQVRGYPPQSNPRPSRIPRAPPCRHFRAHRLPSSISAIRSKTRCPFSSSPSASAPSSSSSTPSRCL